MLVAVLLQISASPLPSEWRQDIAHVVNDNSVRTAGEIIFCACVLPHFPSARQPAAARSASSSSRTQNVWTFPRAQSTLFTACRCPSCIKISCPLVLQDAANGAKARETANKPQPQPGALSGASPFSQLAQQQRPPPSELSPSVSGSSSVFASTPSAASPARALSRPGNSSLGAARRGAARAQGSNAAISSSGVLSGGLRVGDDDAPSAGSPKGKGQREEASTPASDTPSAPDTPSVQPPPARPGSSSGGDSLAPGLSAFLRQSTSDVSSRHAAPPRSPAPGRQQSLADLTRAEAARANNPQPLSRQPETPVAAARRQRLLSADGEPDAPHGQQPHGWEFSADGATDLPQRSRSASELGRTRPPSRAASGASTDLPPVQQLVQLHLMSALSC